VCHCLYYHESDKRGLITMAALLMRVKPLSLPSTLLLAMGLYQLLLNLALPAQREMLQIFTKSAISFTRRSTLLPPPPLPIQSSPSTTSQKTRVLLQALSVPSSLLLLPSARGKITSPTRTLAQWQASPSPPPTQPTAVGSTAPTAAQTGTLWAP